MHKPFQQGLGKIGKKPFVGVGFIDFGALKWYNIIIQYIPFSARI